MAKYNLVQLVFDRENLRTGEDVAITTCHIREAVGFAPDWAPLTDTGRAHFISALDAWWAVTRAYVTQHVTFREARFYEVPDTPGVDMGQPVEVHGFYNPGAGTSGALPPQVAISVTFRTAERKRWGRMYLPCPARSTLDDRGAIAGDVADALLPAFHHLTDRSGTGGCLVVFSQKHWTHQDPEQIQIDDVFDVVRRRRYSSPLYRKQIDAG